MYILTEVQSKFNEEKRLLEEEHTTLAINLQQAQDDLELVLHHRGNNDKKVNELDELVAQLLHLNEVLVSKLTESNISNASMRKILGIAKRHHIPAPTESSKARARSASRTSQHPSSGGAPGSLSSREKEQPEDEDILRLHSLHKMYKSLARSLTDTRNTPLKSITSDGRDTSTAAGKVIHRKRSEKRNGSSSKLPSEYNEPTALSLAAELRALDIGDALQCRSPSSKTPRSASYETQTSGSYKASASTYTTNEATTAPTGGGSGGGGGGGGYYKQVVSSLEDEYEALSMQYKRVLQAMQQAQARRDPIEVSSDDEEEGFKYSEELMIIMKQLQKKREQIRALKASTLADS